MKEQSIMIVGFGNQGKTWALNLRDSGLQVFVALRRESKQQERVFQMGLSLLNLDEVSKSPVQTLAILTPDHTHLQVLTEMRPREDQRVIFAHGHGLLSQKIFNRFPRHNFLLLAPKSIASQMRLDYETKTPIAGVYSLEYSKEKEKDRAFLQGLALDLGIHIGPYEVSFEQETQADLFSEQALLCGLIPFAAAKCFDILQERGMPKELIYFEVWHELKLIIQAMVDSGPQGFFDLISPNALIGGFKAQKLLFDKKFEDQLNSLMDDIQNGEFQRELDQIDPSTIRESLREFWKNHSLQKTFEKLNQVKRKPTSQLDSLVSSQKNISNNSSQHQERL